MFPYKLCLSPLRKLFRTFLEQFKAMPMKKIKGFKGRKHKKLFSGSKWTNSSFTNMEVDNQMEQVFKIIDANGDGKISSLELEELLLCLGHEKSTAAKEAEGMLREADCNGNGNIDLEEFKRLIGYKNELTCCKKESDLMDAFLIFDSDKNGFISAKELQQVLVSLGYDECTLKECSDMIKGVDKDGDGLVDFEEFQTMMKECTTS